ncbi:hypothetical protein [Streptomyces cellulosae]|uniref:hypothetical protein n=1 Tax=Streptomyces cellulosae TaxID=1968 RepID=UPI00131D2960|nr:hypothetical protein [Streptomyces cellulosae]
MEDTGLGERTGAWPRLPRVTFRVSAALAVAIAAVIGFTTPASAGGNLLWASGSSVGKRWTVCAQSLAVRSSPNGPAFGYLYGPDQTFTIYDSGNFEFGGEWVRGHAWGNVNADGYVQNGWFCFNNP